MEKNDIELKIESKLENVGIIRNFLRKYLEIEKIEKSISLQLISAVDELLTNIVEHAYEIKDENYNEIKFVLAKKGSKVYITIEDYGIGIGNKKNENTNPDRGMGLKIVKGMVDEFRLVDKSFGTKIEIIKEIK